MTEYGEHNAHARVVVRANVRTENEQAWLMCSDCLVILTRLHLCGAITKRGATCRTATRASDGSARCRHHRDMASGSL
jgi:hypothetical protein